MSGAKIIAGLKDAIAFAKGDRARAKVTTIRVRDHGPRVVLRNPSTGRAVICPRKPSRRVAAFWRPVLLCILIPALGALGACSTGQEAQFKTSAVAFEAKAAPVVAQACATLHAVEANPLLQTTINIGVAAANGATSGIAGGALGIIKAMGDAYCANGPPVADTTTPAQQARWLLGQIVPPLRRAVGR